MDTEHTSLGYVTIYFDFIFHSIIVEDLISYIVFMSYIYHAIKF